MPRRNPLKVLIDAIDSLREALQIMPVRKAVETRDKRSSARVQKLVSGLEKQKPSRVAAELQISTQKYVAIRRQVQEGKVSSKALGDLLETASENLQDKENVKRAAAALPHVKEGEYTSEAPVRGKRKFKVDYEIASQGFMKKKMPWAVNVSKGGFGSLQSAINWYGGVAGGKEYFWIVKNKKGRYFIYDIRTPSERNKGRKGKVSGKTRAEGVRETYEEWFDMYDEFSDDIEDEFGDDFGEEFEDDYEEELETKPRRKTNAKSKGKRARAGSRKTKKATRRGRAKKK